MFKELQERNRDLTEALEQQTATGEVLRVIASSPTELQPVLDTVIENAVKLAGADQGHLRQYDGEFLQLVAYYNETADVVSALTPSRPVPESLNGRAFLERRPVQRLDAQAEYVESEPAYHGPGRQAGARTALAVPLMREEGAIGTILIWRDFVQPFTERQVDLVKSFADQAVIPRASPGTFMFDLFGEGTPLAVRFFIAFVVVFALIGAAAWLVRRFGASSLGGAAARGRQPRLAVIEAGAVDGRRKLVIVRRDNVEHLIMIGGPTDILIEANIVRGQAANREVVRRARHRHQPKRSRAPSRSMNSATSWPLAPEPGTPRPRPAAAEETLSWTLPAEPAVPMPPASRRPRRAVPRAEPIRWPASPMNCRTRMADMSRRSPAPRRPDDRYSRDPPDGADARYSGRQDAGSAPRSPRPSLRRGRPGRRRPEPRRYGATARGRLAPPRRPPAAAKPAADHRQPPLLLLLPILLKTQAKSQALPAHRELIL